MVLLIFFGLLFLLALPLGELSRITIGFVISFSFLDILVIGGIAAWSIAYGMQKKRQSLIALIQSNKQAQAFLLVSAVFSISLVVNAKSLTLQQFFTSALYILRFISYGSLFFMVQATTKTVKANLSHFLVLGGLLLLLSGYVQYFLFPSLRGLIYFGWDEHFYRMFGTFLDPNFFGLFLVLFFLFILSKLFVLNPQKSKQLFSFLFVLATAIFIAIFLTYSRTALLALTCGILVLFANKQLWKYLFVIIFLGILVAFFAFFLTEKKAIGNNLFRASSASARLWDAKDALAIFSDNPVIGIGFNAYRYAMYRHGFQPGVTIQEDHGASGADSSLLLVLATTGVVGFAAFCLFLWSHLVVLVKRKNKVGLATFVAFFVGSFFVNGLFYPLLLVWFWTILGITEYDGQ